MNTRCSARLFLILTLAITPLELTLHGAVTFSKIIGYGDPMPDAPGTVMGIWEPVLDEATAGSQVLVFLTDSNDANDPAALRALYLVDSARNFRRVVSTATPKPGGGTFSSFYAWTVYDGKVYFTAEVAQMLCKVDQPGGPVTLIAAQGDLNDGTNRLDVFFAPSAYAGGVVFNANVSYTNNLNNIVSYSDLFHYGGGSPTSMIGLGRTAVPGKAGSLLYLNGSAIVRDGEVVFQGAGQPFVAGIYAFPIPGSGTTPRRIVDTDDKAPGSTQLFSLPNGVAIDMDGGEVAFYATSFRNTNSGYYRHTAAAGIVTAVNQDTPIPGGSGNFNGLAFRNIPLCLSGGKMIFRGSDTNGNTGVYIHDGTTLEKIIRSGDLIGGEEQYSFALTRDGFIGNQLLLVANGVTTSALYRATLGGLTPPTVTLRVTWSGDFVEVSWDGAVAGPGAVLESTLSLAAPGWQPVPVQSNPFQASPQSNAVQYFRLKL